jgi:hypothetical protein
MRAQDLRGPPGREHLHRAGNANTSTAQEMSRRYQIHADLFEVLARGDADQTRRLIAGQSLLTASDADR